MFPLRPLISRLRPLAASTLLVLATAAALPARAALLYSQTGGSSTVRISDLGAGTGQGFRSFENFNLAGGGTVQRVTWRGIWYDPAAVVPAPPPTPDVLS